MIISSAKAEEDGDGDGNESQPDEEGVADRDLLDETLRFFRTEAEGLENRTDAVHEVRAKQGHGDHVEEGGRPPVEAIDDHFPGIVDLLAVEHEFVELRIVVFIADACGEMQQVIDDEGEDGEAGEDHVAGRSRRLDGGRMLVGLAGRAVLHGERDGGDDVGGDHHQHRDAENPDAGTVEHVMEEIRVGIERLWSHEDHKVTDQVTGKEKH